MANDNIIQVDFLRRTKVNILPKSTEVTSDVVEEHDSQPIKSVQDIERISTFLKLHGRYRDNMLFILGINMGLRVSDLRNLRFTDLINDDCTFKTTFPVFEIKTRNTRKRKKNRYISINDAVVEAVTLYLEHTPDVRLDDYLFVSHGRDKTKAKPLTRQQVYNICQDIKKSLHLSIRFGAHTFRKTFGFHQMAMSNNNPRKLLLLQQMFGHSSSIQTLTYIGLTEEEMEDAYLNLNLGSDKVYSKVIDSVIEEDKVS